jgi:fused signal recognition particle receptor
MSVQGALMALPLLLVPFAADVGFTLLFGTELLGALLVGALLVGYFATRAPVRDALPDLEEEGAPTAESDEGATVPGSVIRTYTPRATASPAPVPRQGDLEALPDERPPPSAPPPASQDAPPRATPAGPSLLERMRSALGKSRAALQERFDALLGREVDDSALDELEEALLLADVGVNTATALVDDLRGALKEGVEGPQLRERLKEGIRERLRSSHAPMAEPGNGLFVVLVVGVNGSGKTTTIGKLASRYRTEGRRVLLAAADTYRAAAADQLAVWAERSGADLVRLDEGSDPGAVVYQAMERALAQTYDVLIIDTAGRLQTRKPLMEELSKLRRVIGKHREEPPQETLLVLDGTMGQNGLSQATLFHEATPLTGVVVTKLDGTAKGGMILTISAEMSLPVKLIGMGEGVDDLRDFDPDAFVDVLA